jgi:hypothetical protein
MHVTGSFLFRRRFLMSSKVLRVMRQGPGAKAEAVGPRLALSPRVGKYCQPLLADIILIFLRKYATRAARNSEQRELLSSAAV